MLTLKDIKDNNWREQHRITFALQNPNLTVAEQNELLKQQYKLGKLWEALQLVWSTYFPEDYMETVGNMHVHLFETEEKRAAKFKLYQEDLKTLSK